MVDSLGVKARSPRTIERPTPQEVAAHLLLYTGDAIGEKAREYEHLGIELEAYLKLRGDIRGWERLDVEAFVGAYRDRETKISICCNLAALLCWLENWRIETLDMPALYDALLEACPEDASAHAYIRWGGRRARGFEDEPPAEVLTRARRRRAS